MAVTRECRELVVELRKGKELEDYLLTRQNGEPVRDLREAWDALTKAEGLTGLLLHDFRRSAVRNMIRAGVPQKTARAISGHKTDAAFSPSSELCQTEIPQKTLINKRDFVFLWGVDRSKLCTIGERKVCQNVPENWWA